MQSPRVSNECAFRRPAELLSAEKMLSCSATRALSHPIRANRNEGSSPMRTRTKAALASYIFACLALDCLPRFGPPEFRYTGSDPIVPVWDLGWPLALTIYDARSGLHVGPSVYLVLPAQLLILFAAMALVVVATRSAGTAGLSRPRRLHPGRD